MIDRTYKSQTPSTEPIFADRLLRLLVMSPTGNSCYQNFLERAVRDSSQCSQSLQLAWHLELPKTGHSTPYHRELFSKSPEQDCQLWNTRFCSSCRFTGQHNRELLLAIALAVRSGGLDPSARKSSTRQTSAVKARQAGIRPLANQSYTVSGRDTNREYACLARSGPAHADCRH